MVFGIVGELAIDGVAVTEAAGGNSEEFSVGRFGLLVEVCASTSCPTRCGKHRVRR